MSTVSVPMSSTKTNFMNHIALDPSNPHSTRVYEAMMAEAEWQFKALTGNHRNAVESAKGPPYKWADIQRGCKDSAVACIRQNASSLTARYYALGDWVIIWCLYTVFRNRDGRRDNTVQQRHDGPPPMMDGTATATTRQKVYDMIRDEFR